MIIAIDGPSGTGKSTVAQKVAQILGFLYFDTGAMYRAFAYLMHTTHRSFEDSKAISEALRIFDFDLVAQQGTYRYFMDGEDISAVIRQEPISKLASDIAKKPHVREALLPLQRTFAKKGSFVMEGRDIGTVVFPDAEVKVFLTATPDIRAQRRLKQLQQQFPHVSYHYDKILEEIQKRDENDQNRSVCPLKPAPDAVMIDTSHLSFDQVVQKIVDLTKEYQKRA